MNWDYTCSKCQSWGLNSVLPNCKAHVFFLITCHLQAPTLNLIRIFILVTLICPLKNWKQKIVVAQSLSHVWLLMTPGRQHARLPVLHYLLKDVHILVHWVGDAVHTSPFAFHLFQHQGLAQWISSLYQRAQVLDLQHQSFQLESKTK